jgi:phage protein U
MEQQFALLGDIAFNLITYLPGFDHTVGASFAEHALIERKPRLQWVGDELDEITIDLSFHAGFCQPEAEMARLRNAVRAHEALTFMFANGHIVGDYVLLQLKQTASQTMTDGTLIAVTGQLTMKEYVVDLPNYVDAFTEMRPAVAVETATGEPAQTVYTEPEVRGEAENPVRGGDLGGEQ